MPSGKPRRHKTNPGGRPSNKERYDQQQAQIGRLRQLVSHRNHSTETWQLVDRLLTIINELEDQSTPQRSTTWDNTGHTNRGHQIRDGSAFVVGTTVICLTLRRL